MRAVGFVPADGIEGRVVLVAWPPGRIGAPP